jgi:hypothetical protein
MLIPSISKAKRTYYGCSSSRTEDYRNGATVRPKVVSKATRGTGDEVLKKKGVRKYTLKPVGL